MSTFDQYEVEISDEEKGSYKLNIDADYKHKRPKKLSLWTKYGDRIILAIGVILITGISFEAGFLKGQKNQQSSIVVNQPASSADRPACAPCSKELTNENELKTNAGMSNSTKSTENISPNTAISDNKTCAYVASKNSNKYHLSTCQWAQKIKPENKICFSSADEAQKRGYQPAKCCIK